MRYDQKYKNYTLTRLLLENYLRPVPLRLTQLVPYAGHVYDGIKSAKNRLKTAGRIKNDITVSDHPDNMAMNLSPLEDLKIIPKAYTKINEKAAAKSRAMAAEVLKDTTSHAKLSRLTDEEVKDLLSAYIRQGAGGKDFVQSVNAYLTVGSTKEPLGIPAPLSAAEMELRALRVLASCPPEAAEAAIARYRAGETGRPQAPSGPEPTSEPYPDPDLVPEPSLEAPDPFSEDDE